MLGDSESYLRFKLTIFVLLTGRNTGITIGSCQPYIKGLLAVFIQPLMILHDMNLLYSLIDRRCGCESIRKVIKIKPSTAFVRQRQYCLFFNRAKVIHGICFTIKIDRPLFRFDAHDSIRSMSGAKLPMSQ